MTPLPPARWWVVIRSTRFGPFDSYTMAKAWAEEEIGIIGIEGHLAVYLESDATERAYALSDLRALPESTKETAHA